ncbi:hypothetical protein F5141DRAFT_1187707 [Pisolithus sp. B1]|nr:hypothetical protein F5141DRAFT_1187707 [Pisolithus sp. B1]
MEQTGNVQVYKPVEYTKLPSPLKELVTNARSDTGKTDADKAEVIGWIDKVAVGDAAKAENFQDLDAFLTPRTYVVSNYFTAADVALYGALHPTLSQLQPSQYYATPAITRYFDHIQLKPSVLSAARALSPAFSLVTFDLDSAPKIERKAELPKKKEKPPKPTDQQPQGTENAENVRDTEVSKEGATKPPKEKKEKKEKNKDTGAATQAEGSKKKGGTAPANKPAEDDGEPVPSMIDMRVGHIVDVKKHPDADSLYIEQIDLGEETGPRTVVSGLSRMRDKYLVAICNLKPANMRGVKSFAMVLAATSKDGKEGGIELIQPPPGAKPGDRVYFEGPEYENAQPLSQLNPKKKIFETIQPGFTTLETKEAAWINPDTKSVHRIRTKDGVCVAPTFVGASLS